MRIMDFNGRNIFNLPHKFPSNLLKEGQIMLMHILIQK